MRGTEVKQKIFLFVLIIAYALSLVGKVVISNSVLLLLTHFAFQFMCIALIFTIAELTMRCRCILRPDWWDSLWGMMLLLMSILSAQFFIALPNAWEYLDFTKEGLINIMFHIISPVLTFIYLYFILPTTFFKWRNALLWLIYPIAYIVFSLFYFNFASFGLVVLSKIISIILLFFTVLSLAIIAINNKIKPLYKK